MDMKKEWTIPILFLMLPFAFLSPGLIWKSQLLFFIICPVFIIALNLKNLWIRAFLLYAAAWQIFIFLMGFNHKGFSPGPGLSMLLAITAGAIIFKFISESKLPNHKWFMFIRIAVIVQILVSLPQPFGLNPVMVLLGLFTNVQERLPGHLVGTLGNRNYLAAFIAMSVPFFAGWRTFKIKGFTVNPALILIFVFLGFCLSPGTLAAIIGLTFLLTYEWSWKGRLIALSVGVKVAMAFAAVYVLTTGNHLNEFTALPAQLSEFLSTGKITTDPFQSDLGRFAMWMTAISQLLQYWGFMVFGMGPAAFWGRQYPIHGQYVSVWFQFGLVGLGLMLGYFFTAGRFLWKAKSKVLLTALLILCLDMIGNFPLEIASTSFMAIIICGLIERERQKRWLTT
jgi:hypothetical protein